MIGKVEQQNMIPRFEWHMLTPFKIVGKITLRIISTLSCTKVLVESFYILYDLAHDFLYKAIKQKSLSKREIHLVYCLGIQKVSLSSKNLTSYFKTKTSI